VKATVDEIARMPARIDKLAAALVHGEDHSLVRETAARIAHVVVSELSDPFRVVVMEADAVARDAAQLNDELAQLAPAGDRRLVWLRSATDRHTALIEETEAFTGASAPAFLLVEAGALAWRSTLKAVFEGSRSALSFACAEGAGINALLRDFAVRGFKLDADAQALLLDRVGSDHGLARQALEKLALFKGEPGPVTRADIVSSVEDAELGAAEDVVDAALDGKLDALERALVRARAAGTNSVTLIRAAQRNCQRMDLVLRSAASGRGLEEAVGNLRPPLPFSLRRTFASRCSGWTTRALERAMTLLLDAEVKCKTTALPDTVVAARTLMDLARLRPAPRVGERRRA
jgi:DNA polymerase-3 subunit delta